MQQLQLRYTSSCCAQHKQMKTITCESWILYFSLALRRGVGLHHHSVPAEHDSSELGAGQTVCSAAAARPRESGPTCDQRDLPHHHEGVDRPVQPGQVRVKLLVAIILDVKTRLSVKTRTLFWFSNDHSKSRYPHICSIPFLLKSYWIITQPNNTSLNIKTIWRIINLVHH